MTPDPLVAPGSVEVNDDTRTIRGWPAEPGGQVARIWYWGHEELMEGEAPEVWALDAKRRRRLAPGRPGKDGSLRFPFSRDQAATYQQSAR